MNSEIERYIKNVCDQADSYEETIQSLIAFDAAVRWDDISKKFPQNSYRMPGRRFDKMDSGEPINVTPDLAIQLTAEYGIVAEAKLTASTEHDFEKAFEQIRSYDGELKGWKTKNEYIGLHDLSLLVHDLNKSKAGRWFLGKTFKKNFTIIGCAREQRSRSLYKIEKYHGDFSDQKIQSKLIDPVAIPMEKLEIVRLMSCVKFYDARPIVEYTMSVLWMNAFNEIAEKEGIIRGKMIRVDRKKLTSMLQSRFAFPQEDARQPKIPREAWIREALDVFVKIGYATKDSNNNYIYDVNYSFPRKTSMLKVFARKYFESTKGIKSSSDDAVQLNLSINGI